MIPRLRLSILAGALLALSVVSSALAQTVPPGGAAPVPVFPPTSSSPPNTSIPASMSNTPFADVIVSFFGPSSTVIEFLVPRLVVATVPVGCYSGPNATSSEGAGAELFSIKPAGTEFIAFFVRGSRTYAFDTTTGNYCWIDNHYTPH